VIRKCIADVVETAHNNNEYTLIAIYKGLLVNLPLRTQMDIVMRIRFVSIRL
jgi:hypothetical protein